SIDSNTERKNVDDSQILRIGISPNAPPLIYKEKGKITGLEASLAQRLGTFLGQEIKFVEVPWSKQFDYLNDGVTDIIMSGMTITEKRSLIVDFTTPYLRSGQIMLIRLEDRQLFSMGITSVMNTNYKIGTVADTISDFFVTATITKANEVVFKTSEQAVEALVSRDIDVFVYDAPIICYYAGKYQAEKLVPILSMATEEYLAWAVRKNDAELKEKINGFVEMISSGNVLRNEIKQWIPYLYSN
ncbi:MAG: transporter substrate-binding domain-containing protein, partial [Deltaproteobacteria bacterium]|nr:transporter substrate-binding domain-containing protein [Deltaproteobacteria bacterium]